MDTVVDLYLAKARKRTRTDTLPRDTWLGGCASLRTTSYIQILSISRSFLFSPLLQHHQVARFSREWSCSIFLADDFVTILCLCASFLFYVKVSYQPRSVRPRKKTSFPLAEYHKQFTIFLIRSLWTTMAIHCGLLHCTVTTPETMDSRGRCPHHPFVHSSSRAIPLTDGYLCSMRVRCAKPRTMAASPAPSTATVAAAAAKLSRRSSLRRNKWWYLHSQTVRVQYHCHHCRPTVNKRSYFELKPSQRGCCNPNVQPILMGRWYCDLMHWRKGWCNSEMLLGRRMVPTPTLHR